MINKRVLSMLVATIGITAVSTVLALKVCGSDNAPEIAALSTKIVALEASNAYFRDRQLIVDAFSRFTRGFDRQDEELVKSVFWPDAQVNYGAHSYSRDEFIAKHLPMHLQFGSYAHHITSQTVDLAGDVAHVESCVIAFFRAKDDTATWIAGGRYIDRFDRRKGEWRVAVREFIPHFSINANSDFASRIKKSFNPEFDCGLGTRDRRDPSYRRPLSPRSNKETGAACAE